MNHFFLSLAFLYSLVGLDYHQEVPVNRYPTPSPVLLDHPRYRELSLEFRELGEMVEVGGVIWSGVVQAEMSQIRANDYCMFLCSGARLPTKDEYVALSRAMGSVSPEEGAVDYDVNHYDRGMVLGMRDRVFWSGSVLPFAYDQAYSFDGNSGAVSCDIRFLRNSVRCVF